MSRISDTQLRARFRTEWLTTASRKRLPALCPVVLQEQVAELVKFFVLCRFIPEGEFPLTQDVDEVWHACILETRRYEALCRDAAGRFIHHSNIDSSSHEQMLITDLAFLAGYVINFGELSNSRAKHWAAASRLMAHLHVDLRRLNEIAREQGESIPLFHISRL
jgi:hypothetical protein